MADQRDQRSENESRIAQAFADHREMSRVLVEAVASALDQHVNADERAQDALVADVRDIRNRQVAIENTLAESRGAKGISTRLQNWFVPALIAAWIAWEVARGHVPTP